MYVDALKDKTQYSVLDSLETIRIMDGRPLKVLQTDNGKEFQNAAIKAWFEQHDLIVPLS